MENRKLYRNPNEAMIGGVCAGLGEYLNFDSTIIRLVFAFLSLAGLAGVWIYLVMWLIVPPKPESVSPVVEVEVEVEESEEE